LAEATMQHVRAPTLLIVGRTDCGVIKLNRDALAQLRKGVGYRPWRHPSVRETGHARMRDAPRNAMVQAAALEQGNAHLKGALNAVQGSG
jgi:hypothetical protein